ncbi:replication initiation protein [Chromohalobacter sp. 48-RD10]|uniref:replication initiation protein n=1 Tax=Chromohalobacter sp. 48-RD10 TaxID=2994063 RepID=UPI0024696926|nr:replication initiation protein [Chromohalobacter sp. 48-RD10]
MSQVRRDQPITDEVMYSVSVSDYSSLVGTSSHSTYKELADAALRLKRREVWLREYPNGNGKRPRTLVTGWVQSIAYIESEGRIELRFSKDMLPYLTQLTEQFTRYALEDIAKMTSSHAIRLYELLCQWRDTRQREVSIEWIRESFQLGDKYPAIKDFKRRVIEPAVEQINEHSPIWVKWSQRKTGRRVSHFVFMFGEKTDKKASGITDKRRKPKRTASADQGSQGALFGIPRHLIEQQARPGESYEDAALRLLQKKKRDQAVEAEQA